MELGEKYFMKMADRIYSISLTMMIILSIRNLMTMFLVISLMMICPTLILVAKYAPLYWRTMALLTISWR